MYRAAPGASDAPARSRRVFASYSPTAALRTNRSSMPRYRALYTDYPWADVEIERQLLAEVDCELIVVARQQGGDARRRWRPAMDVILTCWAPVTARVIDAADRCRHIARTGIGLDNIDVAPRHRARHPRHQRARLLHARSGRAYAGADVRPGPQGGRRITWPPRQASTTSSPGCRSSGSAAKRSASSAWGRSASCSPPKAAALGMRVVGTNRSGQTRRRRRVAAAGRPARDERLTCRCKLPLNAETRHLINRETLAPDEADGVSDQHVPRRPGRSRGPGRGPRCRTASPGRPSTCRTPSRRTSRQPPWNDPRVIVTPHVAFYSSQATQNCAPAWAPGRRLPPRRAAGERRQSGRSFVAQPAVEAARPRDRARPAQSLQSAGPHAAAFDCPRAAAYIPLEKLSLRAAGLRRRRLRARATQTDSVERATAARRRHGRSQDAARFSGRSIASSSREAARLRERARTSARRSSPPPDPDRVGAEPTGTPARRGV